MTQLHSRKPQYLRYLDLLHCLDETATWIGILTVNLSENYLLGTFHFQKLSVAKLLQVLNSFSYVVASLPNNKESSQNVVY